MNAPKRGATRHAWFAFAPALLVACGGGNHETANPAGRPEDKVLHVYNWSDYIGETTIADFEAKSGIEVTYDTYDSNEILETKLLTGHTGYDVVFPTSTIQGRMSRIGVFRKLDKSLLPNLTNMDSEIMRQIAVNDPGNEHAIGYMWGTTGLGYNPVMVKKALGIDSIDSWGAIFDPAIASKLAKCGITMLDAPEDVFEAGEIYLGNDPGNEDLQELAAVEALVTKVRPFVRSFDANQHVNALASGEICISLSWSGLMLQARDRGAVATRRIDVNYVIPNEGAPLWFDTAAIPADAPHPVNAHAFLNFLMEPEVIAAISNDVGYANGNSASLPYLEAALRNDPSVYPAADIREKLHVSRTRSQEYSRELNRAWTRVKSGQ